MPKPWAKLDLDLVNEDYYFGLELELGIAELAQHPELFPPGDFEKFLKSLTDDGYIFPNDSDIDPVFHKLDLVPDGTDDGKKNLGEFRYRQPRMSAREYIADVNALIKKFGISRRRFYFARSSFKGNGHLTFHEHLSSRRYGDFSSLFRGFNLLTVLDFVELGSAAEAKHAFLSELSGYKRQLNHRGVGRQINRLRYETRKRKIDFVEDLKRKLYFWNMGPEEGVRALVSHLAERITPQTWRKLFTLDVGGSNFVAALDVLELARRNPPALKKIMRSIPVSYLRRLINHTTDKVTMLQILEAHPQFPPGELRAYEKFIWREWENPIEYTLPERILFASGEGGKAFLRRRPSVMSAFRLAWEKELRQHVDNFIRAGDLGSTVHQRDDMLKYLDLSPDDLKSWMGDDRARAYLALVRQHYFANGDRKIEFGQSLLWAPERIRHFNNTDIAVGLERYIHDSYVLKEHLNGLLGNVLQHPRFNGQPRILKIVEEIYDYLGKDPSDICSSFGAYPAQ